jgi:uncharacterized damage-inducible protein DinB
MPGLVRPVADGRDALLAFLGHARDVLRITAYGLDDAQVVMASSVSPLTVAGLIKHAANVEKFWINEIVLQGYQFEFNQHFELGPDESLATVLEMYNRVAADTERVVAGIDDLSQTVPVPSGVPWFPDDVEAWTVRWVLLHLIQETARHAGHADIVRESVDGATAFALMAAVEGWPATEWIQPWRKRA